MNDPIFHGAITVADGMLSLSSTIPVPGLGALFVNAFLIDADEPMLVDAGMPALAEATVDALGCQLDPADLRWIWLTHCDADHVGALERLLELAPNARVVTNYLGMGKLSMRLPLPPERFYLVNPGQWIDLGGRRLQALTLPSYDAPETMGLFDPRAGALLSADCFGALLSEQDAMTAIEDVAAVDAGHLAEGMIAWTSVDAPWLRGVRDSIFEEARSSLEALAPRVVLGSHLPPARHGIEGLLRTLDAARDAAPFVGPDQAALEAMLGSAA